MGQHNWATGAPHGYLCFNLQISSTEVRKYTLKRGVWLLSLHKNAAVYFPAFFSWPHKKKNGDSCEWVSSEGRGCTWLRLSQNELWVFKRKVLWHTLLYWVMCVRICVCLMTGRPLSVGLPSQYFLWPSLRSEDKGLLQRLYLLASGATEALSTSALWETEGGQDQSADACACAKTHLRLNICT